MNIDILYKFSSLFLKQATRPIIIPSGILDKLTDIVIRQLFHVMELHGALIAPNGVLGSLTFPLDNVKGEKINVQLIMTSVNPGSADSENVILGGGRGALPNGNVALILKINNKTSKKFLNKIFQDGVLRIDIYDVISHELTHVLDIIPDSEQISDPGKALTVYEPKDESKYYNLPSEVRAYLAQIARGNERIVKDYLERGLSFSDALHRSLSEDPLWQKIEPLLTRENKNHILKGIWTHMME